MEEKENNYQFVPNDVIQFTQNLLQKLKTMGLESAVNQLVDLALVNLEYHPIPPKTDIAISFRQEDNTYSMIYCHYKIEVSCYVSADSGMGYDHFCQYNFRYDIDGNVEQEGGEFYQLEHDFLHALEQIKVSQISISDEE